MTLIGVNDSELLAGVAVIFIVAMVVAGRAIMSRFFRPSPSENDVGEAGGKLIAKLSSKGLAAVIVQALVENKMMDGKKEEEAVQIAARKIDLRKALGDY